MLSKKLIKKILATALDKGGDFAEVFFEDKKSNTFSLENSKLEQVKTGYDLGVGIRVLNGEQVSYAYTDDLSKDSLLSTAQVAGAASQNDKQVSITDLTTKEVKQAHPIKIRPNEVSKQKKVDFIKQANQAALEFDESIQQVKISYGDYIQQVMIANSEGLFREDERIRTRLRVNAIASDGEKIQTGSEGPGLHVGFELFDQYSPQEIGEEAARQAVTMLQADPAPSGQMPVVINNGFGGVLFHEACGHGLEADAIQKESSVFADKVGEQVASSVVTAIDDATVKNAWGSFNIDDEGVIAQETVLIKDGILQDYMYDRKAAKKGARESTGNGRRQSFRSLPIPRMTNTFIAPGEDKPEDIIAAVDDGLYAKKLSGGQVEPATGEFVFTVAEGYLIKDGQIDKPVRGATLVGRGIDVLNKISMVGDDLKLAAGACGKSDQSIPAAVGQPTLLVDQITVGGTERRGE
ncbi:putative Zn-dependent protease-like protein [Halobacteroides halobius DSM 5150]|uniref:Putative Zn-dependent protease-like protein n=1 Tax=Halobacteroides halobius (strain ATCC 35273 / DSM 5150 / MD-1) TaxID=748449 RepID=L0K5Y6_HALHC|nr:TldD/PmbA family protein [Halobacteroides halobius]AGB40421.1 putative Zn-dependent protease-like protein [Halobacteroides halobius DSM 5150]